MRDGSQVAQWARVWLAAVGLLILAQQQAAGAEAGDPYMGDWEGRLRKAGGGEEAMAAQVIALGDGLYRANLLPGFDQRVEALGVWEGKLEGNRVGFGEQGAIEGESFSGKLPGADGGSFTLKKVVRLSPTLGAAPPEGAVVLFDGASLDEWSFRQGSTWEVDLAKAVGGSNRVAYLRTSVLSPTDQGAVLEVGSDDGVKVWLNDAVVHTNNVFRPLVAGQDKVDVRLREGSNVLMLKVSQGGGGWGASARLRSSDGGDVAGLRFEPAPEVSGNDALREMIAKSPGAVYTWELAGPCMADGVRGEDLIKTVFEPEKPDGETEWRLVNQKPAVRETGWRLVEGKAMEVGRKAGNTVSKRTFRDHKIHLEFRTPFMPKARGQGRGNSGVYVQGRYEVQVLDSYGLEGRNNECGGIYKVAAPRVNMCAPPLQWQTYDITFRAPRFAPDGAKIEPPRITVLHNGVLIHDGLKVPTPGGADARSALAKAGPLLLQDHGNPVRYRNVWVLELD